MPGLILDSDVFLFLTITFTVFKDIFGVDAHWATPSRSAFVHVYLSTEKQTES